jgi:hypothetical protein
MAHHKRGRPKNRRSGCLMCKPHKLGKGMENDTSYRPYRNDLIARSDIERFNERVKQDLRRLAYE